MDVWGEEMGVPGMLRWVTWRAGSVRWKAGLLEGRVLRSPGF